MSVKLFGIGDYIQLGITALLVIFCVVVGFITEITVAKWICFGTAAAFTLVNVLFVTRILYPAWKNPIVKIKK